MTIYEAYIEYTESGYMFLSVGDESTYTEESVEQWKELLIKNGEEEHPSMSQSDIDGRVLNYDPFSIVGSFFAVDQMTEYGDLPTCQTVFLLVEIAE